MLNVLLPLLLLLLPHDAQAGKDDVMIVEPAAMIVEPPANGKWQVVEQSSLASSTQTTTQSREARKGKVELDLFQVEKGLVKNIGVSNWNCQGLRDLLSYAKIKPSVLQVICYFGY